MIDITRISSTDYHRKGRVDGMAEVQEGNGHEKGVDRHQNKSVETIDGETSEDHPQQGEDQRESQRGDQEGVDICSREFENVIVLREWRR